MRKPRDLRMRHSNHSLSILEDDDMPVGYQPCLVFYSEDETAVYTRPSDIREIAEWLHRAADYIQQQRDASGQVA